MQFTDQSLNNPSVEQFQRLQGVWRSRGYGKLLLVEKNGYVFYDETVISCVPVDSGTLEELVTHYEDLVVSPGRQAFNARRATGVTRVGFRRLKQLPDTIQESERRDPDDPEYNFEVFWHSFAEHYALFTLKNVDWDRAYRRFRKTITSDSASEDLFSTLVAMLRPLRDGHVRLHAEDGYYSAAAQPHLYTRLEQELEDAEDSREVTTYLSELREWLRDVIHEDYLGNNVRHGAARLVEWGRLSPTTGYLNIRAMAGQSGRIGYPAKDLAATDAIMQKVLAELGDCANLVVDVRGNGGGYDGVALRFAAYLIDRNRVAFTKSARCGSGFTRRQKIPVTPIGNGGYSGNLYVLTSELTASAAEIFVLSLLQHPRLTLVGESTQGILSDTLEKHLPNGWSLTLSNEIYRAFDRQLYEDVGIPPHIELPFLDLEGREQGCDPMLDWVLRHRS